MKGAGLVLFACIGFYIQACRVMVPLFGKFKIDKQEDSIISSQQILKIKGLENEAFSEGHYTGNNQIGINYRLFTPQNANSRRYPLIIVFHGSGQIGNDNKSQLGLLPKLFAQSSTQENYPAYILAPQFPSRSSNYEMDNKRGVLVSSAQPCLETVLSLIDSLKRGLNIDPSRIYLVGYSMGGSTVINALSKRPDLFAAGISIAGIPQFDKEKELSAIPIWLIHGTADTENPIRSDEHFYKSLSSYKHIRFWKLNGRGHGDIFSTQILGDQLPKWLFAHTKPVKE